ncbi:MAG TPA: T9SS type A sorting domain-containing protein, partial [Chryseolinea sp.]|nr:T9SS type A sorting domain-containing protein [Chryseolinea sp.]
VSTTPNQGTLFSKAWNTTRNYQYQIDDISGANSAFSSYIGNALDAGTVTINTNAWVVSSHTNTTATKSSFSNEAANFSGIAIVAGADASTEVLIGARRDTGPANSSEGFLFTGSIAEIMMYNRVVNAAQRIIISDYLAAKYAVTLSANDFYTMDNPGNGDFDYEVAGIGQAADGSNHRDARGTGIVRMWNPNNLANGEFLIWGHDNTTLATSTTLLVGAPIQERLSMTWRVSELSGDVGTVSVSFDISTLSGTPLGSNLRLLIDRNNNGFADNDVTPIAGTFVDNTVVFSGINFQDDDKFTLGNTDVTKPLPIELISFSAKLNNDNVELKWSTASERNNNFFTIERASNIEEFEAIGNPIEGKGTTAEKNYYGSTDENPPYGRSYYRLKQTDFDGKFTYSDLRVIDYEGPRFPTLKVYPNPSQGHTLTIEVTGLKDQTTVPVQIYNVQGQKVYENVFEVSTPGSLKHDFEFGSPLKNGLYIIKAGQTLQLRQKIIVD